MLKGGSGRLWASKDKLRLELQSDNGDAQIVVAGGNGFVYDGPSDTAYTFALPKSNSSKRESNGSKPEPNGIPALSDIVTRLTEARRHASISQPSPRVVAGQPAYTVRVTPTANGGLLGAAELAWDAAHAVPLRIALYARGDSAPTVELTATDIRFGSVDSSVFAIRPPAKAKTVDLTGNSGRPGSSDRADTGSRASQAFTPNAPASLSGKARRQVKRNRGGAVVLYGRGLGSIAVIEHKARGRAAAQPPKTGQDGRDGQPLELPSVSINGAKATALGTPLGGVVTFERSGVAYTVVGSQPLSVLEDAARGL